MSRRFQIDEKDGFYKLPNTVLTLHKTLIQIKVLIYVNAC